MYNKSIHLRTSLKPKRNFRLSHSWEVYVQTLEKSLHILHFGIEMHIYKISTLTVIIYGKKKFFCGDEYKELLDYE